LNRAAAGVLEALLPKKPGRKAMPQVERRLREENERSVSDAVSTAIYLLMAVAVELDFLGELAAFLDRHGMTARGE
jgi:hypothetical protein